MRHPRCTRYGKRRRIRVYLTKVPTFRTKVSEISTSRCLDSTHSHLPFAFRLKILNAMIIYLVGSAFPTFVRCTARTFLTLSVNVTLVYKLFTQCQRVITLYWKIGKERKPIILMYSYFLVKSGTKMTSDSMPKLPETKIRSYASITEPELVDSFLDPVRRAILVAMRNGADGVKKESRTEEIIRGDGTKVTTTIVEEKPYKRFWMTVPEIVKYIEDFIPEVEVSKYNCYYHLPKLREQGLIDQYPPPEFDDEGNEISSKRGVYYRRTAKVFVVSSAKMSGETVDLYLKLFEKGFEVRMGDSVRNHLEDLLIKQVSFIDDASGYLAAHLKEVDVDSTALSDLLTGMSYIFLSDNEEFLKIQRELKMAVLTPCCGPDTDMKDICSFCGDPLSEEEVLRKQIDGKILTFCDDGCATSYQKDCTTDRCTNGNL